MFRQMNVGFSIRFKSLFCSRYLLHQGISSLSARMASIDTSENKENIENDQIVNIETVIAADNKGIDYDKLIRKLSDSSC